MDERIAKKLEQFFTEYRNQVYKKGQILIRADDDPLGVFYLKSGTVKVYVISKKGDELVLNLYKPISFFPMTWAINNSKNIYYYEAVTDVEIYRAPREDVVAFIKDNPDLLYDLMSRVYRGIDGMLMRMTFLMSGNAYSRLITELLIQGRRFGSVKNDSVVLKMSEKELAASAGMTRETVSREMKSLKDKGFVSFGKSTVTIKSMMDLERELSLDL